MATLRLLYLLFVITICSVSSQTKQLEEIKKDSSLVIEGNNVWVRSTPMTGKVVNTLNNGNVCTIIKRGKKQSIGLDRLLVFNFLQEEKRMGLWLTNIYKTKKNCSKL